MSQGNAQVSLFPSREPRAAWTLTQVASQGLRGLAAIGEWFRQAREAEVRMSRV